MSADPLPVACTLSAPELRSRRAGLLTEIAGQVRSRADLPDGFRYRFAPDALLQLATLIDLERRCCSFLTFRLTVAPASGDLELDLTGPDGTRPLLESLLPVA